MAANEPLTVPCPTCRQPALYGPANPWRPFCSERCRSVDLGAWASERFRVPAETPPDDAGEPAAPDVPPGRH
ncbi:MAG: DNA gyrase inhibitor YacG [Rubrivivax sp.]|nr:DNA gyrase inhibitor YacG [Rubrivivax sp.]